MHKAFIGLGSNLGDKKAFCLQAVEKIGQMPCSRLCKISRWYLTSPVGVENQAWYLNGAVLVKTALTARALLDRLLEVEKEMGRVRMERWEARKIDLDLLFYGNRVICEEGLEVPHPRLHLRRFALVPLLDLDPDWIHPLSHLSVRQLLASLNADEQEIIPLNEER